MNWIDASVVLLLLIFTLAGVYRGFVRQVFSLSAVIGGVAAGFIFYDIVGKEFIARGLVSNEAVANVGGFIILSFVAYVVIQMIGWITAKIIGNLKLDFLNRLGGALIGLVIGTVVAILFVFVLSLFYADEDKEIKSSKTLPYLAEVYGIARETVPDDLRGNIERARDLIREKGLEAAMKLKESENVKKLGNIDINK